MIPAIAGAPHTAQLVTQQCELQCLASVIGGITNPKEPFSQNNITSTKMAGITASQIAQSQTHYALIICTGNLFR